MTFPDGYFSTMGTLGPARGPPSSFKIKRRGRDFVEAPGHAGDYIKPTAFFKWQTATLRRIIIGLTQTQIRGKFFWIEALEKGKVSCVN